MIDDDLHDLGELPRSTPPIRPLGQIRLRADELRRSHRRRSLAGGTASLAGVGVVTLLVTGLPGTLLSAPAPATPGAAGSRVLPPCQADPTATGAPSSVPAPAASGSPSDSAPPSTAPPSTAPPSTALPSTALPSTALPSTAPPATATPVEPDPGVPWTTAPQLLHVLGSSRPVEARMDEVTPLPCRDTPPTVYAGADRGPAGTVRAAIAVDGPWPQRPDLPELRHPLRVRGTDGVAANWRPDVVDGYGVLAVAWREPGTGQWWRVRTSGMGRQGLQAAVDALDLTRLSATVPQRFSALPVQRMSTRSSHYWQVTYRRGADSFVTLSVADGARDDGPFARLADVQADRVRLVDVAGGLAFFLPHDDGDSPSAYLVRNGLTFQVTGEPYRASVQDLAAVEHVTAGDPRLKGVPPSYLGPDPH